MHSHSHDNDSSVGFTIVEFIGGMLTNSTAISKRSNPSLVARRKRSASSLVEI